MKNTFLLLLTTLLITGMQACSKSDSGSEKCPNSVEATFKNLTGLDGCGYVLELADGTRLEVSNLNELGITPAEGLQVNVEYSVQSGMASICMVGPIVRVTCIDPVQK